MASGGRYQRVKAADDGAEAAGGGLLSRMRTMKIGVWKTEFSRRPATVLTPRLSSAKEKSVDSRTGAVCEAPAADLRLWAKRGRCARTARRVGRAKWLTPLWRRPAPETHTWSASRPCMSSAICESRSLSECGGLIYSCRFAIVV